MAFAENYFSKHSFLIPQIKEPPEGLLSFIVIIPAYLEEDIIDTLECLHRAEKPERSVEVIVVFNASETDTREDREIIRQQYLLIREWSELKSTAALKFFTLFADRLPKKHAGAGLARKIGMDEALSRFNSLDRPEGVILSLDADTRVSKNYFTAIEKSFNSQTSSGGCLIPFCHPTEGKEFGSEIYRAITQYELHLRYYKHILQSTGFPYPFYTIGSCFGVKAKVYARCGGMNRKKAGEDFYFMNKLFPHIAFNNVSDTLVFPSPRPSLRVPFGTGPVIHELIQKPGTDYLTYCPQAFYDLKKLFDVVPQLYCNNFNTIQAISSGLSNALQSFLKEQGFSKKMEEIRNNTSSSDSFRKRFYLWFDGFKVVKYLNFVHQEYYEKIAVKKAAGDFLQHDGTIIQATDEDELLKLFRKLDNITSE